MRHQRRRRSPVLAAPARRAGSAFSRRYGHRAHPGDRAVGHLSSEMERPFTQGGNQNRRARSTRQADLDPVEATLMVDLPLPERGAQDGHILAQVRKGLGMGSP